MGLFLVIPPLAIIGFIITLGVAFTARPLSEGIVGWLKDAGRVGAFIAGPVGAISVRLTQWITHHVGAAFADLERLAVAWFSGLYQYADLVITNAIEWPLWLWRLQRWLLFVEIPKLAKAVPHMATTVVHSVTTRVVKIERTIVRLPKLTKAQAKALVAAAVATYVHPFLAELQWLRRHFHALTVAIPRALPIPTVPAFPNVWKRLRALERKLAVPVGIAAVVAALTRLGLGLLRCNNVKSNLKRFCGINPSLLDSLLLDTLAVFSIVSVVEFAKELRTIEDEAVSIMGRLVREWPT